MLTSKDKIGQIKSWLWVFLITILFSVIYLILSYKLNIWIDESFTLSTISDKSFVGVIRNSIFFEGQPPFYFIMVFFWGKINDSVFFMRLLSTLFTISSGLLLYRLYTKNSSNWNWWIILLVFANPFMLYLATEIRTYSLIVLFSVLLISFFQEYYCKQNLPVLIRVLYIIISIAAVNTQYFIAFLLLSNGIYLFVKGYKKTLISYLMDMSFVLISISWVPFAFTKQTDIIFYKDLTVELNGLLRFIPGRINDYIFNRHLFPFRIIGYFFQSLTLLAILLNLFLKRQFSNFISNNLYLIVQILSITLWFYLAYFFLGDEFLSIRHTAILFPVIFLLFLRSFDSLRNVSIKGLLIFGVFSFYFISSFNYYKSFVKDFDVKSTIEYLTDNSKEDESIIIIRNQLALPFLYYFKENNQTHILPYTINDSTGFRYIDLRQPLKRGEIEKLLLTVSETQNFWVLNYLKQDFYDGNYITTHELLNFNYFLESDTIIGDPKQYKSFRDIQIRKYKHK